MKKTFILIALAAVTAFISCEKTDEGGMKTAKYGDPVFTASILKTKTIVNTSTGKVDWEDGDEVTITDASSVSVVYTVSSISEGKATLTKKAGESGTLGSGPYTAVYGPSSLTSQDYAAVAGDLPMTAASATTELTFSVYCGLMEVTLTKDGESISSVAVSDGVNTYTLNCATAQEIAGGKAFCVALPAGSYTSFVFTNENGGVCTKTGGSVSIAANQIQPISFSKLSFTYNVSNTAQLDAALSHVQDGDKIILASGTYVPATVFTATPAVAEEEYRTFEISKNITLEGEDGAILDGDLGGSKNAYHVITITASAAAEKQVLVKNIKIRNGKDASSATTSVSAVNGASYERRRGAALYAYGCNLVVKDCEIYSNGRTDGAIYVEASNASFKDCYIHGNTGSTYGAAFFINGNAAIASFDACNIDSNSGCANYVNNGAKLTMTNSIFQNNAGNAFGAIYVLSNKDGLSETTALTLIGCDFYKNSSSARGGAVYVRMAKGTKTKLHAANCTFRENTCSSYGSAIHVYGSNAEAEIYSCTLTGNSSTTNNAGYGGAIATESGSPSAKVYNCIVSGNASYTGNYPDLRQVAGTITSEGTVNGGTVSDYLASDPSSKSGFLTKAYKVKTAATTAGMDVATLKSKYTGGDSDFENALGFDQWGASRAGTTAGACVTAE